MQFSPDLQESDTIGAFVNDLSRNCYFNYERMDDSYPHIKTMIFKLQYDLMQNETANPANKNFDVKITGTTNMTSTLGAYGFAAKGHYYQMSDEVFASKPKIVDKNGEEIPSSEDNDDTYLGVEKYSGACLIAMERIFMNMVFYGDDLFQN